MKDKGKKFVLYVHSRNTDGIIFYVGIGSKKRSKDRVKRSLEWKEEYRLHGRTVKILSENLTLDRAKELEKLMIPFYGRRDKGLGFLVNKTDGGQGTEGYEKSDEQKQKHRDIWTDEKKDQKREEQKLIWSDEEKRKEQSVKFTGENNPMYNINWFDLWVEKHGKDVADQMLVDLKTKQSIQRQGENNGRFGKSTVDCWTEQFGEEIALQMWEEQKPKHSVKNKWIHEFGEEIALQMWEEQKQKCSVKGSKNGSAKVTEDDVRWIRQHYIPNHPTYGGVALREKFNLKRSAFHSIISGKTWVHIL